MAGTSRPAIAHNTNATRFFDVELLDGRDQVVRLRIRAEELTQSAQASLQDLDGSVTGGVAEPRRLPSHDELR
jgi:hypothetical protein